MTAMTIPARLLTRIVVVGCLATVCLLAQATLSAQGFKWWMDEEFIRELGLTQEQTDSLEEVFQAALPSLRLQMRALDHAEDRFERLVADADDEAVMDHVAVLESARAELNKTRTIMLLRMRKVLTAEQRLTMTALQQKRDRERMRRGRP